MRMGRRRRVEVAAAAAVVVVVVVADVVVVVVSARFSRLSFQKQMFCHLKIIFYLFYFC